ncbi:aldehyde dehydrogenase family protein [Streptomyces jeddahensis]|uniref:aldehyde dehydrogenase family protein n=1 Tax=Streptomyces jeddahensis TaxID=1716141 RepID=UPI00082BBB31|nr:aldehyde dehydrogenase family protein [Streptomyces jeddahensis]
MSCSLITTRTALAAVIIVLAFAASNFPFAFGVAGGDAASALAAGCPVLVKAHPGPPASPPGPRTTSRPSPGAAHRRVRRTAGNVRAHQRPRCRPAGRAAPADQGAAFTGSTSAGRALFDLAAARPEPIPLFGELGSINPVFVTPRAAAARGTRIAEDYVASFTLGVGQFCTKPGRHVTTRSFQALCHTTGRRHQLLG